MATTPIKASPLANPFMFDQHDVRTAVDELGNPWFCATDVFDALQIKWSGAGTSLKSIPEEWVCTLHLRGQRGSGEVLFVSEPALYRLIFRSNKPQAVEFSNWVCEVVLPAIRKQGFFGQISPMGRVALSKQILAVTQRLVDTNDGLVHQVLVNELRDLCNAAGRPVPDVALIGRPAPRLTGASR